MISPNKTCAICKKGYRKVIRRSHSMRKSIARLQPNLQWYKLPSGSRIKVCTKCIKSIARGKVQIPKEIK